MDGEEHPTAEEERAERLRDAVNEWLRGLAPFEGLEGVGVVEFEVRGYDWPDPHAEWLHPDA